jgi:putative DNA primase/helicase
MLVEVSELNSFGRAEVTRIKQFVSCPHDRFRSPYERRAEDLPRRCVLVGTTNEKHYLQDTTGGRRFLPVSCGAINLEKVEAEREQLFAEAVAMFSNGAKWWGIENAPEEQEARRQDDPWEEHIGSMLIGKTSITMSEVLGGLLLSKDRQERKHQLRAAACFRILGWERREKRHGKKTQKVWIPA